MRSSRATKTRSSGRAGKPRTGGVPAGEDGQVDDEAHSGAEDDEEAAEEADETVTAEHEEDEGAGEEEAAGGEKANGRSRRPAGQARSARRTSRGQYQPGSGRRGNASQGNGRRRAGAAAQRGDST